MAFYLASAYPTRTDAAIVAACRQRGIRAYPVTPAEAARRALPGDLVLVRVDVSPTLDGVDSGIWKLRRLADGVRVLNRLGPLLTAHDKLGTAVALAQQGLPHPRTAQVDEGDPTTEIPPPLVVKPRFGSWGKDVFLCPTQQDYVRCLRRVRRRRWFRRHGALVQELVPPRGRDMRLVVARGELVGAIERIAAPGEWRTNICLGGQRRRVDPPPDARAIAERAASAIGCDLVGVDLLPLPDGGWTVLELNAAVEMTRDYSLDGSDVYKRMADALTGVSRTSAERTTTWVPGRLTAELGVN